MKTNFKMQKNKGFTLVELLMVMAIVSILATIVLSSLRDAKDRALDAQIKSDLAQVRNALELYANENNFIYPPIVANNTSVAHIEHSQENYQNNKDVPDSVSLTKKIKKYILGEVAFAQSRSSNCQSFDNLQTYLSEYIGELPKHPLDNGEDVCYKYFSLNDGSAASIYTSLITETYDIGVNKQVGVVLGNTETSALMQLCQENLTATNILNGNTGAHPYPMFSGSDHCSGEIADEIIGVSSGNGQVTLVHQCTLSQYTNQSDCVMDRSYCSDNSYTTQSSCETNGVSTPGSCSGGSSYTDESSCTGAGYSAPGSCSGGGHTDESSCTSAGYYASGYCSGGGHTDQTSCTGAGEFTQGYCSNNTYTDQASCVGAGTWSPGSCSGGSSFTDESSCTSAGYTSPSYCSDWQYGDSYSCTNSGATWYQDPWTSYGYTWTPGTFSSYGYTWTPGSFTSYGYTWTPTDWRNYGYTWTSGTWISNNYTWTNGTYTPHTWTSIPGGSWNLY